MAIAEMVGASLTGLTVRRNESLLLKEPSLTVTVIVVDPDWLAKGVAFSVRFAPDPPKTRFALGIKPAFEEVALNTRLAAGVSASPTVKLRDPVALSSLICRSGRSEIVGGKFGVITVSVKESLALSAPSLTVTVIVAVPVCPAAGVSVIDRLFPLPPKTMLPFGTKSVFDELALTIKLPAGVSVSLTVKARAGVGVFRAVVWLTISLSVGAAAAGLVVIASDQPPANCPSSPFPSSRTYKDHVPFGLVPLNTESAELLQGPAGAGAGNESTSPVSPGSTLLGRNVPAPIAPVALSPVAAASERVKSMLLRKFPPPTSERMTAFCPAGPTKSISRSAGYVCEKPRNVTVTALTFPNIPETLIVDGYGVALPTLGIVTTAPLVKEKPPELTITVKILFAVN